ncbi:MAG: pyridoxamine 5'-phosphate oxidase family protein, partial [Pseudomonadota bacterium]
DGAAMILRVYGAAHALHPRDADWDDLAGLFPDMAGSRQIFDLTVDLVQTSCGTGVPQMTVETERAPTELLPFFEDLGPDGVREFWRKRNAMSVDGRPTGILGEELTTA